MRGVGHGYGNGSAGCRESESNGLAGAKRTARYIKMANFCRTLAELLLVLFSLSSLVRGGFARDLARNFTPNQRWSLLGGDSHDYYANDYEPGPIASLERFSFSSLFNTNPSPPIANNSPLKCGQRIKWYSNRIVGGRRTTINRFPWMVSLQRENRNWLGMRAFYHSCGGSLISGSWIVTAAHCLYNRNEPLRAVAGTDNLNSMYRAQVRGIARQIVHPRFNFTTYDNDIALLKVDQPFNLDSPFSQVNTVCLSQNIPILPYDIGTICGFGSRAFQAQTRTHLYETQIAIVERRTCNRSFEGAITNNMICAGGMIANRRDACSGDSGGPLTLDSDQGRVVLAGVVSFGQDCARASFPGIYTNVQNYFEWILSNIDESPEIV